MSFGSHKTSLIASIGSGGFSLGIAKVDEKGAHLISSMRAELPIEKRSKQQAATAIKGLLEEKGAEFLKEYQNSGGHHRIRKIYALLQAPLIGAEIVSTRRVLDKETRITDALLDDCAKEAIGDMPSRSDFLGAKLLQVRINGYPTKKAEGKYATQVELDGFVTTIDPSVKELIFPTLSALLPSATIEPRVGALAIAHAAGVGVTQNADSLIVCLGTDGTDIVIVRGGVPQSCGFVDLGIREIAERVAPGKPVETTIAAMRIAGERGGEVAQSDIETALGTAEPEIAKEFGEALAALSTPLRLPVLTLLLAPPEMTEWFSQFLSRIDFAPFTLTAQPLEVKVVEIIDKLTSEKQNDTELALALGLIRSESEE